MYDLHAINKLKVRKWLLRITKVNLAELTMYNKFFKHSFLSSSNRKRWRHRKRLLYLFFCFFSVSFLSVYFFLSIFEFYGRGWESSLFPLSSPMRGGCAENETKVAMTEDQSFLQSLRAFLDCILFHILL